MFTLNQPLQPTDSPPIILASPDVVLLSLDGDSIQKVNYTDTDHFQITRELLKAPRDTSSTSLRQTAMAARPEIQ